MPVTVIATDDLADRMLKHKLWNGKRTKTLYDFPANLPLWDEYFLCRDEGLRIDKSADRGNAFYIDHRAALEAGARVGWPARVLEGDVSAIQSAMHLWHRSPSAFAAEYQNEPIDLTAIEDRPRCRGVEHKLTRLKRGQVPSWATRITAGIDIQLRLLYYVVIAWADDFTGAVIDYGAFPDQARTYFTLNEAAPTLQRASGIQEPEGSIWWGLEQLAERLSRPYIVDGDNGQLSIERALVDVGWGDMTETAYRFLESSPHRFLVPSKGKGVTAALRPMDEYTRKPGETHGLNWILSRAAKRKLRKVAFDTNWWKTFVAARCSAPAGNPGSLSVFGESPERHRLLADHLGNESCVKTIGNGREVWEWRNKPGDNHLFDCAVMATVAASVCGVSLDQLRVTTQAKQRIKLSDLRASKR
jgi:phage terminase large subunit GpA-like protein